MKKCVLSLLLVMGLVCLPALSAGAEVAKKGTVDGVLYYSGTHKTLFVKRVPVHLNYEVFGIQGLGPKTSPFFHASCHCLGSMYNTNFKTHTYVSAGTCIFTRPDGDKIVMKISAVGQGARGKGKWTIVGGTGKLRGITGQGTFLRVAVRPAARGTFQGFHVNKGTYRIP